MNNTRPSSQEEVTLLALNINDFAATVPKGGFKNITITFKQYLRQPWSRRLKGFRGSVDRRKRPVEINSNDQRPSGQWGTIGPRYHWKSERIQFARSNSQYNLYT